jgi:hypothetical protein
MTSVAATAARERSGTWVLQLYVLTLFLSAFLLFFVQPMFTKMVLPRLGGAPTVWNTAMVFFQATLLGGYLYAHLSTRLLGLRRQTILHGAVLLAAAVALPIGIGADWTAPTPGHEIVWLLGLLGASVGLPFFAVSATAPLLQQWFAHTDHPAAGDPYFLYGASNVGSLLALLAYPVLVEPTIGVRDQSLAWTAGYAALAALIGTCAMLLWRRYRTVVAEVLPASGPADLLENVTWRLRGRWLVLSAVPSALLLGVTLHIGTEIAAVPFFWVIPLALYLLTFVLVFARRRLLHHSWMLRAQIVVIAAVAGFYIIPNLYVVVGLHVLGMFVTAMVCHGELARLRPRSERLTEFYLWMSIGGVVGGLLTAIVAPLVFNAVYEYPLALVLGLLVRPSSASPFRRWLRPGIWSKAIGLALDVTIPTAFLWIMWSGWWAAGLETLWTPLVALLERSDWMAYQEAVWNAYQPLLFTVTLIAVMSWRKLRLALSVAAVIFMLTQTLGSSIDRSRTFFGVYNVIETERPTATYRFLYHGRTNHGGEIVGQPRRGITYYAAQGPVGQLFLAHRRSELPLRAVAVTGLGVGALACHVDPGPERTLTYFEIDPEVERLARKHFDYLSTCGDNATIKIGDGRLTMQKEPDGAFDMIVLDAFAGDAVPAHLLTREAFQLYLQKLSDTGWLVVHITNNYVNLLPVMEATLADLGLSGRHVQYDEAFAGDVTYGSHWVVAARDPELLRLLDIASSRWLELNNTSTARAWTDDFSNLFRALRWREAGVFSRQ